MTARIAPAAPPYPAEVQAQLDRLTPPGKATLSLFTLLANDQRLFQRLVAGSLLDRGNLTLRQREIVIDRITALGGCEYEWGVHVALFRSKAGLTDEQVYSLVHGTADDDCWEEDLERILIRTCDALHGSCTIPADVWGCLSNALPEPAILEVLMLAGFYRTVTYLANATELPLEPFGARFPEGPHS
jgi:alkylhydroperoxidase family enzyme